MFDELFELTIDGAFASKDEFNKFAKEASNEEIFSLLREGAFSDFNEFNSLYSLKKKDEFQPTSPEVATESITKEEKPTTFSDSSKSKIDYEKFIEQDDKTAAVELKNELTNLGYSVEESGFMVGNALKVTDNVTGEITEIDLKPIKLFGGDKNEEIDKVKKLLSTKSDSKRTVLSKNQITDLKENRADYINKLRNTYKGFDFDYTQNEDPSLPYTLTVKKGENQVQINMSDLNDPYADTNNNYIFSEINKFVYNNMTDEEAVSIQKDIDINDWKVAEEGIKNANKSIDVSVETARNNFTKNKDYFKQLFSTLEERNIEIPQQAKEELESGVVREQVYNPYTGSNYKTRSYTQEEINSAIQKYFGNDVEALSVIEQFNKLGTAAQRANEIGHAKKLAVERFMEGRSDRTSLEESVRRRKKIDDSELVRIETNLEMMSGDIKKMKDALPNELDAISKKYPNVDIEAIYDIDEETGEKILRDIVTSKPIKEVEDWKKRYVDAVDGYRSLIEKSKYDLSKLAASSETTEQFLEASNKKYGLIETAAQDLKDATIQLAGGVALIGALAKEGVEEVTGVQFGVIPAELEVAMIRKEMEDVRNETSTFYKTMRTYEEAAKEGTFGEFALRTGAQQFPNVALAMATSGVGSALSLSEATVATLISTQFGVSSAGQKYDEITKRQEYGAIAKKALDELKQLKGKISEDEYSEKLFELERASKDFEISSTDKTLAVIGTGLVEGVVSRWIGTIPNTFKVLKNIRVRTGVTPVIDDILLSNLKATRKAFVEFGKRTGGEIIEETAIDAFTQINDYAFLGDKIDLSSLDDVTVTAIITAGGMNVPSTAYSTILTQTNVNRYKSKIKGLTEEISSLKTMLGNTDLTDMQRAGIHNKINSVISSIADETTNMEGDALLMGSDKIKEMLTLSGVRNSMMSKAGVEVDDSYGISKEKIDNYLSTLSKEDAKKFTDQMSYIDASRNKILESINYDGAIERVFGEKGTELAKDLDPSLTPQQRYVEVYKQVRQEINDNALKEFKDAIQEQETRVIPDAKPAEGVQEMEEGVRELSVEEKKKEIEQRRQEELNLVNNARADSERTGELPVVNGELVSKKTLDDINSKYDAELAALDTEQTATEEVDKRAYKPEEVKETTDAAAFAASQAEAIAQRKDDKLQVAPLTQQDAQKIIDEGGKLFMTEDGKAGAYVTADGYMGGLFKQPGANRTQAAKVLQEARIKAGGKFFDAFGINTESGKGTTLEDIYIKNGFRPVARMTFNPEFAPKGWEKTNLKNRPDNVFFVYDPTYKATKGEGQRIEDYDKAYELAKNKANETKAGNRLFNEPLKAVKEIADRYYKRVFKKERPRFEGTRELDVERAKRISDAFEAMKNDPNNPEVKKAYEALAKETIEQYKDFIDAGYVVEINNEEPYANSAEMIEDLRVNKRIKIFSTESGFGDNKITDKQRSENPLLRSTEFTDSNGVPMLVNDLFRAIHDFYGHAELGNSFGPKGEENAWNVHARMFSPLARRAMTTETRGQNSWVNFSGVNKKIEALRDKARKLREQGAPESKIQKIVDKIYEIGSFAEQKIGLLPEEFSNLDTEQDTIESEVEKLREMFKTPDQRKQVDNALNALSKIAPDVEVILHESEQAYAEVTNEQNRAQKTAGEYNHQTKTIHINPEKANVRTVAHEVFHAILLNIVKTDAEAKRLTEAMMKAVAKVASPELKAYLDEFASNYDQNIRSEEKLAELVGKLASEYDSLPKPTQNVIKRWLDRLAKMFGLKPFTDTEVIDVLNTIAGKVARGEAITQQDLSPISQSESSTFSPRKQIVGRNANLSQEAKDNYYRAIELTKLGKTPKEIRLLTGWEIGKDKKWRYEMFDGDAKIKTPIEELSIGKTYKLKDVLDFPEIYDAYPSVANLAFQLNTRLNANGQYQSENKRLVMNPDKLKGDSVETISTMLHELQHAVQQKEGFARGTSTEQARAKLKEEYLRQKYEKLNPFRRFREILGLPFTSTETLGKSLANLERIADKSDFDIYERAAGEVEARNVEARRTMTESERLNTLLSDTENISRDDQFIIRKQQVTNNEIIQRAKEAGISDAAIRKYLQDDKGLSVKQSDDAVRLYNEKLRKEGLKKEGVRVISGKNAKKLYNALMYVKSARANKPKSMVIGREDKAGAVEGAIKRAYNTIGKLDKIMKKMSKPEYERVMDELDKYLRGNKNANLPDNIKAVAFEMRTHLDNLSRKLIEVGAVPDVEFDNLPPKKKQELIDRAGSEADARAEYKTASENILGNIGEYLNRSYAVHTDKNWKDKVSEKVVEDAKNYLRKSMAKTVEIQAKKENRDFATMLEQEVNAVIDRLLDPNESRAFFSSGSTDAKKTGILTRRLDIAPEIRALTGEEMSPAKNYIISVQKIASLAAQQTFLNNVRDTGLGVWLFENEADAPKGFRTRIASETSKTMNPLNGLYTSPEIAKAFNDTYKDPEGIAWDVIKFIDKTYIKAIGVVKYNKTILSPGTHSKNIIGNGFFMLANGYLNPKDFYDAGRVVWNEIKNGDNETLREKYIEYIEAGVINSSVALKELKNILTSKVETEQDFEKLVQDRLYGKNALKKIAEKAETAYQMEDDYFKIVSYEVNKRQYSKALFKNSFENLTDKQQKEVKDIAKEITKNTLPNYERIAKIRDFLKYMPIGSNFLSFHMEALRVSYNTIELALKEVKDPRTAAIGVRRLAGISAVIMFSSGLLGSLLGFGGDDEDEEDSVRKLLPYYAENSKINIASTSGNEIIYQDLSASSPYGAIEKAFIAYSRGESLDESITGSLKEALGPFFADDIIISEFMKAYDVTSSQGFISREGGEAIAKFIYSTSKPGAITSSEKVFIDDRMSILDAAFGREIKLKEQGKLKEAFGQFTGFGYRVVKKDAVIKRKFYEIASAGFGDYDSGSARAASKDYNNRLREFKEGKVSESKVEEAYRRSNKMYKESINEAIEIYKAGLILDIDKENMKELMKATGFNINEIEKISIGEAPDMKRKEETSSDSEYEKLLKKKTKTPKDMTYEELLNKMSKK